MAKPTPTFDPSRPFGTISPPYEGARFQQDGHYFSGSDGREYLFSDEQEAETGEGSEGAASAGDTSPVDAPNALKGDINADADLREWVRGERVIPFFTVKKIVADGYPDVDTSNSQTIRDGLKALGIQ